MKERKHLLLMYLAILCLIGIMSLIPIREGPDPDSFSQNVIGILYDKDSAENGVTLYLKPIRGSDLSGRVMIFAKNISYTTCSIGDLLDVNGDLSIVEAPTNPGQFDLKTYYLDRKIKYRMKAKEIKVLQSGRNAPAGIKNRLIDELRRLRVKLSERLDLLYTERTAALVKAMLLGDSKGIELKEKQAFSSMGILHILAISGMHITLLAGGFGKILEKLTVPLKINCLATIGFLLFYNLFIGYHVSAVRASVMYSCSMAARLKGRSYDSFTALFLAAAGLAAVHPYCFRMATPWLSFLAVAGAVFGGTGYIWLLTMPVLLAANYELPLYSFLWNMLILPALPAVPVLGLLSLLVSRVSIPTALVIGAPLQLLGAGLIGLGEAAEKLPFATVITGAPALWQIILYYGALIFFLLTVKKSKKRTASSVKDYLNKDTVRKDKEGKQMVISSILLVMALLCILFVRFHPFAKISYLDVGQGDCSVIRMGSKETIMIDCGSSSVSDVGNYRVIPFLKHEGIRKIDLLILSHGDEDHLSGIRELLKQDSIEIGMLMINGKGEIPKDLITGCKEKGIAVLKVQKGDRIRVGEIPVEILWADHEEGGDINDESLVVRVTIDDTRFLFTGDLSADGEKRMLDRYSKNENFTEAEYLQVGHHGSKNSSCEDFLRAVKPKTAVISCGKNNRYGHPDPETKKRLQDTHVKVYVTKDVGAVQVLVSKNKDL